MAKKLLVLATLLLVVFELKAQLPPPCPSNDEPGADLCTDICIYCNFNGYTGSTVGYTSQTPPGFCGTIENEQWLGFIAGAAAATFTATPINCSNGQGVQIALYTSCNSSPLACNGGGGGAVPVNITANLTPGVNYFLLIDGFAGDQCDFTITVSPPSAVQAPNVGNTGNISGPTTVCPGATVTFTLPTVTGAGVYTWEAPADWLINGQSPPIDIPAPGGNTVQVTVGNTSGQICVTPKNSCDDGTEKCKQITVKPIPPTNLAPAIVCNEDAPYELPWGDLANSSGTYETTLISYQGCDSVVRKQVTIKPPIITNLAPKSICAGSSITICGEEYSDPGTHQHKCESYLGCDSTINFSIIVVEPVAQIIPNGVLSCNSLSMILNSAASPGTKIWKNLSGVVLGGGNTLTVTQAGTYILTVTASAQGVPCIQNDTIVITGNTTPPTISATGGVIGCGAAQAQLNSTTNATTPTYLWSPAAGLNVTNVANPIATQQGTYTVVVTDNATGCTASTTVTVTGNTTPPSASATGNTLTCSLTSVPIGASSNVANATFAWTGPGMTSNLQNPVVNAAGTYTVTVTNPTNNCTATATASVTLNNTAPTAIASGGNISCTTPVITLNGNSLTNGVTYSWTGPGGFASNLQNPGADTAGIYNLVVTNPVNGCTSTATATVTGNTIAPNASATGGTVSCGVQTISITGSSSTNGANFAWTGPNGYTSTAQNPNNVTAPGIYTLTVTGPNNCTQTATATVSGDYVAPDASATGGIITCTASSTTISGTSTTNGVSFNWIGPSGNPYSGPNPTVSNTGVYTLFVTALNGCTATATATVVPDANVPNVSAAGGTLNCLIFNVTLDGGSTTAGATLQWSGPNGFTSVLEDPTVTEPGDYILTVSNPLNGCTAEATAIVVLDNLQPGATATGGTVTCADPTLDLFGNSSSQLVSSWNWTGPNGFTSTQQNPNASEAGDYTLVVTATNGCTSSATTAIIANQTPPVPTSSTGTLTCTLTSLVLNGGADVAVTYSWSGPLGFTSVDQAPTVVLPGDYTLETTADNGCTASIVVPVAQDIAAPNVSAVGNTITCSSPQVLITGASNTTGVSFKWSGPNGFTSSDPNPAVNAPGPYILEATGPNGCTATAVADVLDDTEEPIASAQPAGILTCALTSIVISTTTSNGTSPIQSFSWNGPGFTSNQEDPTVSDPGLYTLTVTSANGCTTTTFTNVEQDVVAPDVTALGGTLTCLITSTSLDGGSSTPNVTFQWTGPGFSSTLEDPIVDVEGIYVLTVTGQNGCTSSTSATVVLDGQFPDATTDKANDLDCDLTSTTLTGTSNTPGVSYAWTDESNNVIGFTPSVSVNTPGTYQLAITAPNGCVTNANVVVTQDTIAPGAIAVGDTIDCISGQAVLTGSAQAANVTWSWIGPGVTSNLQNPTVTAFGQYLLTVTGPNGCTSTATAIVAKNDLSPDAFIAGEGTLTCVTTTIDLTGNINTPGATGVWMDDAGNVVSNQAAINVTVPGVYIFLVTAQNGCISAPEVLIEQDIQTPQNVVVNGGLINCTNPTISITANTTTPNIDFSWTGPNGFTSTLQNPTVNASGTYTVLLTNQSNGCEATAVTFVTEDFATPNVAATSPIITCAQPSIIIDASSTTPGVKYKWQGPGIAPGSANETKEDPSVSLAGMYTVTVTAQNGCTQTTSLTVSEDVALPSIATTGVTLTCSVPSNTITGVSQTPGVTYAWTGPSAFSSNAASPTVNTAGNYVLTVTAPNGCKSTSSATVTSDMAHPSVTAAAGTLTCTLTSLTLTSTSTDPNATWQWAGPGGFNATTSNPTATLAGNYGVTITSANGCTGSASTTVLSDTQNPSVAFDTPDKLTCTRKEVSLHAFAQQTGLFSYQWSTQNGSIVSGASSQSPVVDAAAQYSVLVTNTVNGCTGTGVVDVVIDTNTVSDAVVSVRDVSCFGKTDGVIGISSVVGGAPPYLYSLDQLPFVNASTFTSLSPGTHSLVIQDANGCEWETTKTVGEPEEFFVDLGDDITVHLGDELALSLDNTVSDPSRVDKLILDPPNLEAQFCDTCHFVPTHSFRYVLTVVDPRGCKATDDRVVVVDKTRWVYIPNVFDPTSPGNNSIFYISGGTDVERIKSFLIFDRWGNAVFENYNFAPDAGPTKGWDGNIRGDKANPAVFVYYAEILFKDGETVLYKGDVALVRNY